jgi:Questin oxidase-like
MALFALSRIGASDERLIEYFRWWEENRALPRRDSGREIDRNDWHQHIGEAQMFDALSDCFRRRVLDRGSTEVIGAVFPQVSCGVAAAAFHGLIRLAYGIEADHAGEIGAGLATLCSRYVDLGIEVDRTPSTASVKTAFAQLADALGGAAFTGQGIIGKMRAAASDPRFRAAFSSPPIGPALLEELARVSIALYWQTADFTILHMVTASHAGRVLFGQFPQLASDDAIRALWGAACAAYASVGAPMMDQTALPTEPMAWDNIFAKAIISNDDHVIKMTYTCRCEVAHYGNPLYQAAAARLVAVGKS